MIKTITIDGKEVTFKATGGTMYRYKAQFGREYIADVIELDKCCIRNKKGKITEYDMTKFSLEIMYNLAWVLAKTADDSIPDPQTWLDSFEVFPIKDIFEELKELITVNAHIDRKNA